MKCVVNVVYDVFHSALIIECYLYLLQSDTDAKEKKLRAETTSRLEIK